MLRKHHPRLLKVPGQISDSCVIVSNKPLKTYKRSALHSAQHKTEEETDAHPSALQTLTPAHNSASSAKVTALVTKEWKWEVLFSKLCEKLLSFEAALKPPPTKHLIYPLWPLTLLRATEALIQSKWFTKATPGWLTWFKPPSPLSLTNLPFNLDRRRGNRRGYGEAINTTMEKTWAILPSSVACLGSSPLHQCNNCLRVY